VKKARGDGGGGEYTPEAPLPFGAMRLPTGRIKIQVRGAAGTGSGFRTTVKQLERASLLPTPHPASTTHGARQLQAALTQQQHRGAAGGGGAAVGALRQIKTGAFYGSESRTFDAAVKSAVEAGQTFYEQPKGVVRGRTPSGPPSRSQSEGPQNRNQREAQGLRVKPPTRNK
jgi:hypothetical protein